VEIYEVSLSPVVCKFTVPLIHQQIGTDSAVWFLHFVKLKDKLIAAIIDKRQCKGWAANAKWEKRAVAGETGRAPLSLSASSGVARDVLELLQFHNSQ
jgi:hypothetical protein